MRLRQDLADVRAEIETLREITQEVENLRGRFEDDLGKTFVDLEDNVSWLHGEVQELQRLLRECKKEMTESLSRAIEG